MPAADELTRFQVDLLAAVAMNPNGSGQDIKRAMEDHTGRTEAHSRIYQNMADLVDQGLLVKDRKNARTDQYRITARGTRELRDRAARLQAALEAADPTIGESFNGP